jgi:phenylalanyl-tRNA synthetase beta chain
VAEAGAVSKKYLSLFDIDQDVYYTSIDWELLLKMIRDHKVSFTGLPKYPWVRRDLALLVDKDVTFEKIKNIALTTEKSILRDVDLFDVYESDSLGKNKKSYAVSFILRDDNQTLTDKNIDKIMNNLISAFQKEAGAKIR